jgi:hypothetical protein
MLVGLGILALLSACSGDEESADDAFDSPDACMEALVDVSEGDVTAAQLVERCGVSAAEAAAVPARPAEETEAEPVAETTTLDRRPLGASGRNAHRRGRSRLLRGQGRGVHRVLTGPRSSPVGHTDPVANRHDDHRDHSLAR